MERVLAYFTSTVDLKSHTFKLNTELEAIKSFFDTIYIINNKANVQIAKWNCNKLELLELIETKKTSPLKRIKEMFSIAKSAYGGSSYLNIGKLRNAITYYQIAKSLNNILPANCALYSSDSAINLDLIFILKNEFRAAEKWTHCINSMNSLDVLGSASKKFSKKYFDHGINNAIVSSLFLKNQIAKWPSIQSTVCYPFAKNNPISNSSFEGSFILISYAKDLENSNLEIASKILAQQNKPIVWILFGNETRLALSKHTISNLPINITTTFKGKISEEAFYKFMSTQNIDLYLNIEKHKGIPENLIIAASMGIPLASINEYGISELVQKDMGILFDSSLEEFENGSKLHSFFLSMNARNLEYRQNIQKAFKLKFNANEYSNSLRLVIH